MQTRNLVGAATRYIAGRNAVQTVYWRGAGNTTGQQKFVKVSKTVRFGNPQTSSAPPQHVRQEQNIRF